MKGEFEYFDYTDDVRRAVLERRTAELERRLRDVARSASTPEYSVCTRHPVGRQRLPVARYPAVDPAEHRESPAGEPPPELSSYADPRGPGCA